DLRWQGRPDQLALVHQREHARLVDRELQEIAESAIHPLTRSFGLGRFMLVQREHSPIALNGNGDQQSATVREMVIGRAGRYADVLRQFAHRKAFMPLSRNEGVSCREQLASKILAVRRFAAYYSRFPG